MHNRTVSLDSLATWTCWLLGLLLSAGDLFDFMPEDVGYVGLVFVNLGLWLGHHRALAELEKREVSAFNLGRSTALRTVQRTH